MLDFGIIKSLRTRNYLPKCHLEILQSVLKNCLTPSRLKTIFDFKNHQEHPIPKGILDYQPSIKSHNPEQVTNNTQCCKMQNPLLIFMLKGKEITYHFVLQWINCLVLLRHYSPIDHLWSMDLN